MKLKFPLFREGIEWERIPKKHGKGWKYLLLVDIFFPVKIPIRSRYDFVSGGVVRGVITEDGILLKAGYAWNGCSFSPDWELLASLPHDLLFQFSGCEGFPSTVLDRKFCDNLFGSLCVTKAAKLYRAGLWLGSWTCYDSIPSEGDHIKVYKPWELPQATP